MTNIFLSMTNGEGFDALGVGGETAREASFYEFKTFCLERFRAEPGAVWTCWSSVGFSRS